VVTDDPGRQARDLIDALYGVLNGGQNPPDLRALTHRWDARMKQRYRGRCSALITVLQALRAVLATPADESVATATSQAIDDEEAGAPEDDAIGACPNDLLEPVADERASSAHESPVSAAVVGAHEAMGGTRWEEEL
jgi:hypothetical protein